MASVTARGAMAALDYEPRGPLTRNGNGQSALSSSDPVVDVGGGRGREKSISILRQHHCIGHSHAHMRTLHRARTLLQCRAIKLHNAMALFLPKGPAGSIIVQMKRESCRNGNRRRRLELQLQLQLRKGMAYNAV